MTGPYAVTRLSKSLRQLQPIRSTSLRIFESSDGESHPAERDFGCVTALMVRWLSG